MRGFLIVLSGFAVLVEITVVVAWWATARRYAETLPDFEERMPPLGSWLLLAVPIVAAAFASIALRRSIVERGRLRTGVSSARWLCVATTNLALALGITLGGVSFVFGSFHGLAVAPFVIVSGALLIYHWPPRLAEAVAPQIRRRSMVVGAATFAAIAWGLWLLLGGVWFPHAAAMSPDGSFVAESRNAYRWGPMKGWNQFWLRVRPAARIRCKTLTAKWRDTPDDIDTWKAEHRYARYNDFDGVERWPRELRWVSNHEFVVVGGEGDGSVFEVEERP